MESTSARSAEGFTVLELLVVLTAMMLVAGTAVVAFPPIRTPSTEDPVGHLLREARHYALQEGVEVEAVWDAGSGKVWFGPAASVPPRPVAGNTSFTAAPRLVRWVVSRTGVIAGGAGGPAEYEGVHLVLPEGPWDRKGARHGPQ